MDFKELGLIKELTDAVTDMGFTELTPIQEEAIPEIINGDRDLVGLAQTGTGKTACFGLPMLQLIDFEARHTQGLVICPTRELCIQITGDFKKYSKYIRKMNIVPVYGGASIETQIRTIKKGVQIIVATPGRLLDLIKRKVVKLSNVSYLVLDEADEMLNMGFQEDLDAILKKTPSNKRTWLFSATMPREVAKIARKYMTDPVEITAGKRNSIALNIKHLNYVVMEKNRYLALKRIIDFYPEIYGLIFCRTRNETRQVAEKLIKDGYSAEALHGELSQVQRDSAMHKFREKSIQILVATDVAARGLDVDDITHVINYNSPDDVDNYTHRSGRTARAGKSGISIILMNTKEFRRLSEIERKTGIKFTYEKVPDGNAICEKQLFAMINKLVAVEVNHKEIDRFLPPVFETLNELTKEELIQKFVSTEFNRFLDYYKNTGDINAATRKPADKRPQSGKRGIRSTGRMQRFFINAGKMDSLIKGAITRLVCDRAGITSGKIGKIEILREFSFFETEADVADKVLKSLQNVQLDGRKIVVSFSEKKKRDAKSGDKFKFSEKRKSKAGAGDKIKFSDKRKKKARVRKKKVKKSE